VAVILAGIWLLLHKTSFGRVVPRGIQRPDMVAALGIAWKTLHGTDRRAGRRHGGAAGTSVRADRPRASGHGCRDHHRRLRRGGDRGLGSFWAWCSRSLLVGVVRGITIHFVPAAARRRCTS